MVVEARTHQAILKRLKEINQAKDMAYDSAIYDKGAALRKLEAEERELRQALDNSDIMTSRGEGNDDRSSEVRTSEQGGTGNRGEPSPEAERERRPSVGETSEGRGRSTDRERIQPEPSVERGPEEQPSGTPERLSPLIPGALPTSRPKDVILDSNSDIGFDAGAAAKFDANVEAIRTLKKIEAEDRHATPEEQTILARYSGFGDSRFEPAFMEHSRRDKPAWESRAQALKDVTTTEEYEKIETSRLNAFYTTPEVINSMWSALKRMGVDNLSNPRVLEPSAGSGRFFGFQPTDMAAKSQRIAVELDSLTGRILKQQYPNADVYAGMGYQEVPLPKEHIDVAISNVPFGDIQIADPSFKGERKRLTKQVHNYFFAKTIENLRPGGVLAFITSHYTMDAPTAQPIRQALAERADLVGAIRLPKGAFPDTEVVTDIIFMRKRKPEEQPGDQSWVGTGEVEFKKEVESRYSYGRPYAYTVKKPVNQYFINHPEMVLGKHSISGTQYGGDEYAVDPNPTMPLNVALSSAVKRLPENVIVDEPRHESPRAKLLPTQSNVHEGSHVIGEDGHVYVKRSGETVNADLSAADEDRVKKMLAIRDAARSVINLQLKDAPDSDLGPAQSLLQKTYREYVQEHGTLNAQSNAELMEKDPEGPFLKSLENTKPMQIARDKRSEADKHAVKLLQGGEKPKADDLKILEMPIFSKRVIHGVGERRAASESDAIAISKNDTGRLDFPRMAELLGKSEDEVRTNLAKQGLIFKNPIGDWEPADQYLSGDVREKLKIATASASAKPEYRPNVEALRAVQPEDVRPGQIAVKMGAPWVPESDVNQFVGDLLDTGRGYHRGGDKSHFFGYNVATGEWFVDDKLMVANRVQQGSEAKLLQEYGTQRMPADDIILALLNNKRVEVKDEDTRNVPETLAAQEKATKIQEAYEKWLWQDSERAERLARKYNESFNSVRNRSFDGAHLELPGMTKEWHDKIHAHQKDAIWRVTQEKDNGVLLAHEVGFGKTAVMVAAGMEKRRLGLANKVVYVVPKATHAQFQEQFRDIYPYANVLFPSEDDFTPAKRNEFVSRAVTGDWDAIILSDSQFRKVPLKPETQKAFLREEIATIKAALSEVEADEAPSAESMGYRAGRRGSGKESQTHKQLQKALENAKSRLVTLQNKVGEASDKTMYWEDIGVDQLFVDEADNYKNLHFTTKMDRVKGLPNSNSERSWDMYQKVRYLQDHGNKGVCYATGTPIANTIAEMYTMMRYLQPKTLEAKGLKHFDAWAATFGQTTESIEQTPTGAYKMTQRFAKFRNAPELSQLWQQAADIRVADEVPAIVKVRPHLVDEQGRNRRTVVSVKPSEYLNGYMKALQSRADEVASGKVDPKDDNMLKISNDARKASLDIRMVVPNAPADPNGKVATASKKVAEIYKLTNDKKGTQLVFLDLGTPKSKEEKNPDKPISADAELEDEDDETAEEKALLKNVYASLKAQMVADGIPEKEIAFVHDAKGNKQKLAMMDKVNTGEIRVIVGSTGKLGTGTNIQKRAAALHHMDCPWRPRDIEQREGRIIRQGNQLYGPKFDKDGKVIDPGQGVRVYTYVTEKSFDAFMWQAIEAKSKAIKAIMRRSMPPRSIEDVDSLTLSAAEAKAIASGNPDVMKAVSLRNSVNRYQMLKSSHTDSLVRANDQLHALPKQVSELKADIEKMEKDNKLTGQPQAFHMVLGNNSYTKRADAGESLARILKETKAASPDVAPVIGKYRGFEVKAIDQGPQTGYKLVIRNPETGREYMSTPTMYDQLSAEGITRRLDNTVEGVGIDLSRSRKKLEDAEANLKTYQDQADKKFEYDDQLKKLEAELTQVEARLQTGKTDNAVSDTYVPPEEEDGGIEGYHWGEMADEQKVEVSAAAEIEALKAEVETVEKTTEVKAPPASIAKTIDNIAKPISQEEKARRLREIEQYAAATGGTFKKPGQPEKPKEELPKGEAPLALPAQTRSMLVNPKENWELTRSEMLAEDTYGYKTLNGNYTPNRKMEAEHSHRQEIKIALKQGKPVPNAVLKDYPDLAATVQPSPKPGQVPESNVQKLHNVPESDSTPHTVSAIPSAKGMAPTLVWQMTEIEFTKNTPAEVDTPLGKVTWNANRGEYKWQSGKNFSYVSPSDVHRMNVVAALKQGNPVPTEVLKDYPDLVSQGGQEASRSPHTAEVAGSTPAPATKQEVLKKRLEETTAFTGSMRGTPPKVGDTFKDGKGQTWQYTHVTPDGDGKGARFQIDKVSTPPATSIFDKIDRGEVHLETMTKAEVAEAQREAKAGRIGTIDVEKVKVGLKKERKARTKKVMPSEPKPTALLTAYDPRSPRAEAIDRSRTAKTVTHDYDAWAGKRNRVDLNGVDTKRAVTIRTVPEKERKPKERPQFRINRKSGGAGRGTDLGADIVRDRRGRHLRL